MKVVFMLFACLAVLHQAQCRSIEKELLDDLQATATKSEGELNNDQSKENAIIGRLNDAIDNIKKLKKDVLKEIADERKEEDDKLMKDNGSKTQDQNEEFKDSSFIAGPPSPSFEDQNKEVKDSSVAGPPSPRSAEDQNKEIKDSSVAGPPSPRSFEDQNKETKDSSFIAGPPISRSAEDLVVNDGIVAASPEELHDVPLPATSEEDADFAKEMDAGMIDGFQIDAETVNNDFVESVKQFKKDFPKKDENTSIESKSNEKGLMLDEKQKNDLLMKLEDIEKKVQTFEKALQ